MESVGQDARKGPASQRDNHGEGEVERGRKRNRGKSYPKEVCAVFKKSRGGDEVGGERRTTFTD